VQLHTHFFLSWLLPWTALRERRDRVIVALAGIAPDVDGPILLAMGHDSFVEHHHDYTHHLAGATLAAAAGLALGRSRWRTAGFAALAWCGHLLFDMIGAGDRHPGEPFAYTVPLLWPFSDRPFDPFPFAWPLDSWQSVAVMGAALALVVRMALVEGRTPVEVISVRADRAVVTALRRRLGRESKPDAPAAP